MPRLPKRVKPSNNQRMRLSRRLYGKLREIGGDTVEIGNGMRRYELSKFDLDLVGQKETIRDVRDRLVALLTIEGWEVQTLREYYFVECRIWSCRRRPSGSSKYELRRSFIAGLYSR